MLLIDELFLFLVGLRLGPREEYLSVRFNCSLSMGQSISGDVSNLHIAPKFKYICKQHLICYLEMYTLLDLPHKFQIYNPNI